MKHRETYGLLSLALMLVAIGSRASAQPADSSPTIIMELAPAKGTIDDVFELVVRIALPDEEELQEYQEPGLDEFRILDRGNDHTVASGAGAGVLEQRFSTYRYLLAPRRTGLLRIERARARVSGRDYETSARVVEVMTALDADTFEQVSADRTPSPDSGSGTMERLRGRPALQPPSLATDRPPPEIFVHASSDRQIAYVGQQITVTWVLYTRHELIEFEPEMPRLDDFWGEILYEPTAFVRQGEVFLSGLRYQVVIVSKRALFPLRPGLLSIEPYRARASALYTPLGRHAVVQSKGLEIRALPLPAGAPLEFDETYVGLFKIASSVDRSSVALGESLLLTVSVRGHGAIRRTTPLSLDIEGFEVQRVPDFRESVHSTDRTAIGVREYRYWLTPKRAGVLAVPAIHLPYFDPRTSTYESALTQPLSLSVTGSARAPARSTDEGGFPRNASARPGRAAKAVRWWSPAGLIGLAAVLFGLAWWLRARRRIPPRHEQPRVRFQQAERHLAEENWSKFFGELATLMERALEARLEIPVRPLTREQLLAALRECGLHPGLIEQVLEQLEQCDLARFASTKGKASEMGDAMQRLRGLVRDLQDSR